MKGADVISSLTGLAGAVSNNGKMDNTDRIILESLLYIGSDGTNDADKEKQIVSSILDEKYKISPDCWVCKSPCGNTSSYDMTLFDKSPREIQDIKLKILDSLNAYSLKHPDDVEVPVEVYRGIAYFGYSVSLDQYQEILDDLSAL